MLTIFGGIGLFLLGMTMLTNGLKEIAGEALKRWLNTFTKGTVTAIISGALMTILVQSSTATTLLTIGFVSAGLLTFLQSIGVIIGANYYIYEESLAPFNFPSLLDAILVA